MIIVDCVSTIQEQSSDLFVEMHEPKGLEDSTLYGRDRVVLHTLITLDIQNVMLQAHATQRFLQC